VGEIAIIISFVKLISMLLFWHIICLGKFARMIRSRIDCSCTNDLLPPPFSSSGGGGDGGGGDVCLNLFGVRM
jgi:hypothetical protein